MSEPQSLPAKQHQPASSLPALLEPINAALEPLIKFGVANPLVFSPGATVLEVAGRKSGKQRSTPLTCYWTGYFLIIGTVRSNSQWIKNLAVDDNPHIWLWGRRWEVTKHSVTHHIAILSLKWR